MGARWIPWLLCGCAALWQGCESGGLRPGPPGPGDGNGNGGRNGDYVEVTRSLLVPAAASPQPSSDASILALQALLDAPPTGADAISEALEASCRACEQAPNDAAAQTRLACLQLIAAAYNFSYLTGLDWVPPAPDPFNVGANIREEPALLGTTAHALGPAIPPPLRTLRVLWPELPSEGEGLDEAQAVLAAEVLPLLGGNDDAVGALERFCALSQAEGALFRIRLTIAGKTGIVEMIGMDMQAIAAGLLAARAVASAAVSRSLDNVEFSRDRPFADRDADADERLSHAEYLPAFPFMALHLSGEDVPNGSVCLAASRAAIIDVAERLGSALAAEPSDRSLLAFLGDLTAPHNEWAARRALVSGPVQASLYVTSAGAASGAPSTQQITVDARNAFTDAEENPCPLAPTLAMEAGGGRPLETRVCEWADSSLSGLAPDGLMSALVEPDATAVQVTYWGDGCELVLLDAPTRLSDPVAAERATLSGYLWLDLYGPALVFSPDPPDENLDGILSNLDVWYEDALVHNQAVVSRSRWEMRFIGSSGSERTGTLRFTGPTGHILHQTNRVSLPVGEDTVWPRGAIRIPVDLGSGGLGVIVR